MLADHPVPVPPFVLHMPGGARWTRTDEAADDRPFGPTLVVAAGLAELVPAARARGVDEATVELLAKRVRLLGAGDRWPAAFSHVDRSPAGDLLMSTPTTWFDETTRDVHTGEVTTVVSGDLVLAAEVGSAGVLGQAAARLLSTAPTPDNGSREVLAALLLTVLTQSSEVEIELGDAVGATEGLVFSSTYADPVVRIYELKREIAEARRALSPVTAALQELETQADDEADHGHGHPAWAWLPRVQATVDRLDNHLAGHDELLGAMLSAHLAQVSVRQNEDMRKISAWAAMITVPTLVAGIYGMNFQHMPELSWLVGYPAAIVLMVLACWLLYRGFRKSGWL